MHRCLSLVCLGCFINFYVHSEIVQKGDGQKEEVEILVDKTWLRTQFLPVTKQVKLEVLDQHDDGRFLNRCDDTTSDKQTTNATYEIRNGNMYKVTRVKKKRKRLPCSENGEFQRRISSDFQNNNAAKSLEFGGSSDFQKKNEAKSWRFGRFSDFQNHNEPSLWQNKGSSRLHRADNLEDSGAWLHSLYDLIPRLSGGQGLLKNSSQNEQEDTGNRSWKFWTNAHPITSETIQRKKDKLTRLLNLFTIVRFDNNGCLVEGVKGTCYNENECADRSGRVIGACARGFGVCCYIERSCGETTRENCTYFVNEGYPEVSLNSNSICALTVEKASPDVRQLRLEFETFELRGPVDGTCLIDRFLVTGQNRNSIVPDICGVNTGQHMYVDVDATQGPYNLHVVTTGREAGRKFRVKVTQLRAGDALLAPQNCLQYFTDLTGVIESFNYQYANTGNAGNAEPSYFNDLNYDACIKKSADFCSVTYTNQIDSGTSAPFEIVNYEADGEPVIPRGQAGAEVFNCPYDYIAVNGVRLCGDRLNDATSELDYTRNAPVSDLTAGPVHLTFRSNSQNVSRGFRLKYKQNPCND